MESDGENLENIFEENENDKADNANDDHHETSGVKIPAPKRIIRNPTLKFNPERLCGERGIPILVDHFKNVKFKGVGHEKEDLDKMLTKLEHWTHRLFPSMKFRDCLQHIEKLGKKKPVQTCLRKIRLDMPILSSDFVKDEEEDDVRRIEDSEPVEMDAFDRLIEESQDISNPSVSTTETVADSDFMHSSPMPSSYGRGHVLGSSSGSSLTEEQKERMERNRMLAAERRKMKLAASKQISPETQSANEIIIPSQNVFNTHEKPIDPSPNIQENVTSSADDLFSKISGGSELCTEKGPTELIDQNSENLGLDDLIDLVDEKEPVSDKNPDGLCKTICSNLVKADEVSHDDITEVDSLSIEGNVNVSVPDNSNSETAVSGKMSEIGSEDNLGMESLLDLVNEDSEDIELNSVPSCSVMDTSTSDIVNGNVLLNSKELNATINMETE